MCPRVRYWIDVHLLHSIEWGGGKTVSIASVDIQKKFKETEMAVTGWLCVSQRAPYDYAKEVIMKILLVDSSNDDVRLIADRFEVFIIFCLNGHWARSIVGSVIVTLIVHAIICMHNFALVHNLCVCVSFYSKTLNYSYPVSCLKELPTPIPRSHCLIPL